MCETPKVPITKKVPNAPERVKRINMNHYSDQDDIKIPKIKRRLFEDPPEEDPILNYIQQNQQNQLCE